MSEKNYLYKRVEKTKYSVTSYYRSLMRRSYFLIVFLMLVTIFSIAALGKGYVGNENYAKEQSVYTQRLAQLQQKRADIVSGKIPTSTQTFDDQLAENLANLKEYPLEEDFYTVDIAGTNSQLKIDRNNIFASDNAGILNAETKRYIYERNKELAVSTNGSQIVVVTVKELPAGENIESYANAVFTQLGIGNKEENNGILYLVALEDREFRLEVGYGLEGLIPDGTADDIINNDDVVDAFKAENYDQGVRQVVDDIFSIVNTKTALVDSQIDAVREQQKTTSFLHWGGLVVLLLLLGVIVWSLVRMLRAKSYVKQLYQAFLDKTNASLSIRSAEKQLGRVKTTEIYYLMLSGILFASSKRKVNNGIARGKLLIRPQAKKMPMGRVLIGDTLYASNGAILTSTYSTSSWSGSDSGSGSSGGGSWGSFGGGSSGGGGASGGW